MTRAALVVALANAREVRRPTHARRAFAADALDDLASANDLLGPFLDDALRTEDLTELRALQRAVAAVVEALTDGSEPPLGTLNALAAREPPIYALERRPDGDLHSVLRPRRPSPAATLLFDVITKLAELDPARLRRCQRAECRLVFYDTTRSGTQRWHAERPCGLRERQRRHRSRKANGPPEGGPF